MKNRTEQKKLAEAIKDKDKLRATFCRHLIPAPKRMNERAIGFIPGAHPLCDKYFDIARVELIATEKPYGYKVGKGDEFYGRWSQRTTRDLERIHNCSLTGKPCTVKQIIFNNSSTSEGRAYDSTINLECQTRCPAYNGSLKGRI